jgi:hypothetical protein
LSTPAAAQTALPTDPSVESAPGSVYQLPLDSARGDAAPPGTVRRGGGSQPIPGTRKSSSAIRSENGFGSSSAVPGAPAPAPKSSSKQDAAGPAAPTVPADHPPTAAVSTADSGGSSALGAYVLLTLALAAALGMAMVVRRVTVR